jgi:anti-sigma regulatory factor (Ser/Thr protein kinase)/putative methionine-R-sulfoxide reductase with GAF domain
MATPVSASAEAGDRLHRIEAVTDTALAHLDVEALLTELLDRVCELLGVDTAAVLLLDTSARQLIATATRGIEAEVRQGVRIPVGKGFAGRIAAEKRPVVIEQVDHQNVLNPILRQKRICSLLGVPLLAGGAVLGVLHVGTLTPRRFSADDIGLLQMVADRVALATQARRSAVEQAAASALQRSLVPAALPTVPGLELAARYVPGEAGGVGGDWYDVFQLPSGWLGIVMGDVVGRGLRAAVVMGRLRGALRSYALEAGDPAEVLGQVDRQLQHFEPDVMATVLYATLDPSFEWLCMSSAGHVPPVMAEADRPGRLLDLPIDPPLGVRAGLRRKTVTFELRPGAVVCFYTDGLVERRGRSPDVGMDQLRESVVAGPPETVCVTVMGSLIGGDLPGDDVALLTIRRSGGGVATPLDLVLPAVPRSLAEIRAATRRWLSAVGAGPEDIADLLLATGEACSNTVEHAYGPRGGSVRIQLELRQSDVVATIRDTGRWRAARGVHRGRGTLLMDKCSDDVQVEHGPGGTSVTIRRRLRDQGPP